jgi:hypothetical protein
VYENQLTIGSKLWYMWVVKNTGPKFLTMKRTIISLVCAGVVVGVGAAHIQAGTKTDTTTAVVGKALDGVPVVELASKAALLVNKALAQDKERVALAAIETVMRKNPAAAQTVVASIARGNPSLASKVAAKAASYAQDQAVEFALAAATVARDSAGEIVRAVSAVAPSKAGVVNARVEAAIPELNMAATPALNSTPVADVAADPAQPTVVVGNRASMSQPVVVVIKKKSPPGGTTTGLDGPGMDYGRP